MTEMEFDLNKINWNKLLLFIGIIICCIAIGLMTFKELGWLLFGGCAISWSLGRMFRHD